MSTRNPSPLIIGHRGASAFAPENTLAAFARAFADDADGIEFDVRLARDGVPVVIHDRTLRHMARSAAAVANLTSTRLAEIDVGSWFNRKHPRFARLHHSRQTVPTLDQVFGLLLRQSKPGSIAYVEMKTGRNPRMNAALAEAVVAAIHRHHVQRRTVVIGFNLNTVTRVKKLDGAIRTGALFGPRQRATKSVARMVRATLDCGAEEILFHRLLATPRAIERALKNNLIPVVWTVDDSSWMPRAARLGVHALITNNPANMLTLRDRIVWRRTASPSDSRIRAKLAEPGTEFDV